MEVLIADRSERGKLKLTGEQDRWFLHQILTHSFEDMEVGDAREAALLTAHGRMVAYLESVRVDDGLLLHFEPDLKDSLPEALRRYVFATRVEIEDVSDAFGLILVVGEGAESLARSVAGERPVQPTHGYGAEAVYVWVEASEVRASMDLMTSSGARNASEDELEKIRVANVAARWGKEMDTKTIPQEAGIDRYAVHFEKGCYVGQEAMAKIHFRGKVNRRLARLEGSGLSEGAEVTFEDQKVGRVTTALDDQALAILRYTIEPGTTVLVDDKEAKVTA